MKECRTIKNLIQKFLDKDISNNDKEKLLLHLQECQKCNKEFNSYINIFSNLKKIKEQPLPVDFENRLHYKLVNYAYRKKKFISYLKPLTALAFASIILAIVIGNFLIKKAVQEYYPHLYFYSTEKSYELADIKGTNLLPLYKKGNLRIKLKTDKEVKNVEVLINLPEELCLDKKQKIVKWRGDLKPGENYLILNVFGNSAGVYPISIKIKQDSKKKTITTSLKIT